MAADDDETSHEAITRKNFDKLVDNIKKPTERMDTDRQSIGGFISKAAKDDNLHAEAFALFRRLNKKKSAARGEFLFHFDTYRAFYEQNGGPWAQDDIFHREGDDDGAGGESDERDERPDPPKDASADDAKEDLRPRHLRSKDAERAIEEAANSTKRTPPTKLN